MFSNLPYQNSSNMSATPPETPESEPPPKTVVPHVLCDCCSRIVKKSEIIQAFAAGRLTEYMDTTRLKNALSSKWFLHNYSVNYLSKSSATGCHLCSLAVAQFDLDHDRNYQSFVSIFARDRGIRGHAVIFRFHHTCLLKSTDELMKQVLDDFDGMDTLLSRTLDFIPGGYFTDLQLTRVMSKGAVNTFQPQSISTAQAWMNGCLRNHPKCHRKPFGMSSTEHELLPTRLIDIGTVDGKLAPRLILTSTSENVSIQYLTLSHSWAITSTDSALKLTSRNLELLQIHIPIEGLPRTFQDALEITRRLGYRYLWIDSLCIMQDSESDWHREALSMSSIYGNSSCNIAALGVDGADTCFRQRNPLQVIPCQITQQQDGTSIYAGPKLELDTPLLRRGWVMQERLLSPRVLYAGAARLFWECCSHTASEDLQSLYGEQLLRQPKQACVWVGFLKANKYCTKSDFELLCGSQTSRPESGEMSQGLPDPRLKFAQAWLKIVRGYQRTEFTYESDRLIALSGVAKAIEHSKGFTYVAGTWKELWPLDLLWLYSQRYPSQEEVGFTIPTVPSWSWAAIKWDKNFYLENRIGFYMDRITYLAQFNGFTCPTSTARYTGSRADEKGIRLTLKSRVKRGLATWRSKWSGYSVLTVRPSDKVWVDVDCTWDPGQTPKLGESVHLLMLISGSNNTGFPFHVGLAVMQAEGVQKKDGQPCYRRVGYFEGDFGNHETWDEETICLC
ncbi:HET-domain-containing protein [Neurospora crassa]|uniref:Heterokaryon incompatibility domain-containing protein n=1 Tax=Neurospora crassa (strain ATCC 24698 / 74-OR23-1A / CBS 708.71 / DSM 1257 / FGSC 987) TaxID=367110 RepID=Q7SDG1_NEUCR|nr:hypothetical protein NCU08601 [Neurospora crassa OR74A]EAA34797.2 hypothetical protein NCU08601 [Neurospora crassa OR74A]KHE78775.1 HET-domain-containing protein [Neurospora crassa]|eukprot:XP_964033.2 hypothetical protein NCU08601 [Neurospora crassa OR74A]